MKKVLVTGGTGYIGSHTALELLEADCFVASIDNGVNSFSERITDKISEITKKPFTNYAIDLRDQEAVSEIFRRHRFDGVIHFAALKSVPESIIDPASYFDNNLNGLNNVLKAMVEHDCQNLIFSSSCTVYGEGHQSPVSEEMPVLPSSSPYGSTKQMGEMMIRDYCNYTPIRAVSLRYFNPAGAHDSGRLGEWPKAAAVNLVPAMMRAAATGEPMQVHGSDYPTRDGTCIRDYIHISDLARAHRLALQFLFESDQKTRMEVINLGIGQGVTIFEMIKAFEEATEKKLPYTVGPRRSGDVVAIFADNSKAKRILNWTPERNVKNIMESAWKWELNKAH